MVRGKCNLHKNTRSFFSIIEKHFNIVNEKTEITLSEQFCAMEKCTTCKNNKFDLVTNECLLIDLKTSTLSKKFKKSSMLMGDLNLFGWVVLKLDVSLSDELNKPLATKCALSKTYF